MSKRRVLIVVSVLVASLAFYFVWSSRRQTLAASQGAGSVSTMLARRGSLELSVSGTSNVMPSERRTVKSEVSGTVSKVLVKDGQAVKAGQVLAVLSNSAVVNQYEQAKMDLASQKLRVQQSKSPTQSDVSSAQSQVSQAQTALADRQKDLRNLTVTAPISGRIAAVQVNQSDNVSRGQLLAIVVDDTEVLVMAQVAQQDISRVSVGQTATVGFGSELPLGYGTVYSIGAEASATSSGKSTAVPVAIKLSNATGVYRSGLAANVSIRISDDDVVSASGTVSPKQKYDIKAQVEGTVTSVAIRDGDAVTSGQTIVTLQNHSLQSALKKAESDVQVAAESLDKINAGLAPNVKEADLQQQELQVAQSELTLANRAEGVDALQVKSPINGVLVSHSVSVGDVIGANADMFVVSDPSSMLMTIAVDELDIVKVKPGQSAKVTAEALPGKTFDAEVTEMATEGTVKEGVATYDVTLRVPNPTGLMSGMTASATIMVAQKQDVLLVPTEAIKTMGNRKMVSVVRDGSPTPVEVQTGINNDVMTEIISGVQEGESVVVASQRAAQQSGQSQTNPFGGGQIRIQGNPGTQTITRPAGR